MSDPYSFTNEEEDAGRRASRTAGGGALRTAAWLVLVVSAVGNSVASTAGAAIGVHLALGVVTAICVAVLVADRLRPGSGR